MKRHSSILLGALFLSATFAATGADRTQGSGAPALIGWQAPTTYTAPSSGRSALTDAGPTLAYIPAVPCRQYSSIGTPLPDNTPRTVTLSGAPCGIPTGAKAVSVNITIFNITGAGGNGVLKVDSVSPPTVAWINYPSYETQRGNAGVVTTGSNATIVVQVNQGAGSVDFVVDINGYFGDTTTQGAFTIVNAAASGYSILGLETGASGIGVYGFTNGAGGRGVFGYNSSASGFGVQGSNGAGIGVEGLSSTNIGTRGFSTGYNGVWGESTNWDGIAAFGGRDGSYSQGARYGAVGNSTGTAAKLSGVLGTVASSTGDSGGVTGYDSSGVTFGPGALAGPAGVWGWGRSGVAGATSAAGSWGVIGLKLTSPTALGPFGVLGYISGATSYGVFSFGTLGASGPKPFVEPHPTDPSKVIRYVALEGNESGTYFRGTANVVDGKAVITVPESFKMVSDEEGLTIQVTPVGSPAVVWVESQDLDKIVLRSAKDVKVHYLAQGFRRAYKDWEVIAEGQEYRPSSPDAKMPEVFSADAKRRLIQNGTYNTDGTVNMRTAERMGWAQKWHDDLVAAKAAEDAAVAKTHQ